MVAANQLKKIRKEHGLNQSQLADATGYSVKTIWRVETGKQNPSSEFMFRMAAYFNMLMEDLFEIE